MKRLFAVAAFTVFAMQSGTAGADEKPIIYDFEPIKTNTSQCIGIVIEGTLLKETSKSKIFFVYPYLAEIKMLGDRKVSCQMFETDDR